MGINTTPTNYKSFTFDGRSSREFGVYTTGNGVFNAPERAVEMISIPARNGEYALDHGHFNNIEVTYRCGIVTTDDDDFAEAISDFRNWLCSRRGYCRLQDEYNPNEYRMALFKDVVSVEHEGLQTGEFDIVFDCKPQRWLTSGETAVTIGEWGETETVSGDVVEVEATETDAAKSLVADINAEQNLNGYDAPWVGGAGKNKLPITMTTHTINGVTFTVNSDGTIKVNGTATAVIREAVVENMAFTAGTTYTISGNPISSSAITLYVANSSSTIGISNPVDTGIGATFTPTQSGSTAVRIFLDNGQTANNLVFKPMIRLSNTSADFEPYSNTCPISGHTDVTVTVADDVDNPTVSETYTTALGTTVYGGTLDLISGVLTVTHGIVDLSSLSWTWSSNYSCHYAGLSGSVGKPNNQVANCIAEKYATDSVSNVLANVGRIGIASNTTPPRVWVSTGAQANTPTGDLVYELATPQTYQLTPQQIELLLGANNIWADSGDVTLEYGENPFVLVNPTPFDSSPLLEVDGYGTIDLGGQEIELNNDVMGNVLLVEQKERPAQSIQATFATDLLNNNDTFIVDASFQMLYKKSASGMEVTNIVLTSTSGCDATVVGMDAVYVAMNSATFTKGTSATASCSVTYTVSGNNIPTQSLTLSCSVQYDGDNVLTFTNSGAGIGNLPYVRRIKWNDIYGDSTASVLGHPTYIDCDIGECYMIKNNEVISLNQYIDLGSDLPTLPPGATTVNYDNTITDLKIAPRWWKV